MISVAMILKKLAYEHNLSVLVIFSTLIFGKHSWDANCMSGMINFGTIWTSSFGIHLHHLDSTLWLEFECLSY